MVFGVGVQGNWVAHAAFAVAAWDLMAGGPPLGFLGTFNIATAHFGGCSRSLDINARTARQLDWHLLPGQSPFFTTNCARTNRHFEALRHILWGPKTLHKARARIPDTFKGRRVPVWDMSRDAYETLLVVLFRLSPACRYPAVLSRRVSPLNRIRVKSTNRITS